MTKKFPKKKSNRTKGSVVKGRPSRAFSHMYREPSRFPLLPHEMQLALCAEYHDERLGQTTQAARITPLIEFNTILPRFGAEFYQIYRHARIMAIDISMDIVNTGTTPLLAAICCLPLSVCNGVTNPQTVMSVPGSVRKIVGTNTGMSRVNIRRRFTTDIELGELTIGSQTYLQTYSEALSAAVWTELPAIYAGVISAQNGATWSGITEYKYTYHIRFSEYNIPALGVNTHDEISESYVDEGPSYVEPTPTQRSKLKSVIAAGKPNRQR